MFKTRVQCGWELPVSLVTHKLYAIVIVRLDDVDTVVFRSIINNNEFNVAISLL